MGYPTDTDFPGALDSAEDRTDIVDTIWADDFDFQDKQIRKLQEFLGQNGKMIGENIAGSGTAGSVSHVSDGGTAFKLVSRADFTSGELLSVGDDFDNVYQEKFRVNYDGLIWSNGGANFSDGLLTIPVGGTLPSGSDGMLFYKTGSSEGLYYYGDSAWTLVGADGNAIHDNVASEISAVTSKGVPVGADYLLIEDSEAANVKKSIILSNLPSKDGIDSSAIHDDTAGEINAVTEKATPVSADLLLIEDSAAGNVKKRVQVGNLPSGGSSPFEVDVTDNEIQPATANIGRSFIAGSQDMDDSGASNDTRMFFEKETGAFRVGTVTLTQWDSGNRGDDSAAFGSGNISSGVASSSFGKNNQASGDYSHAEGYATKATQTGAHAEGRFGGAYGSYSHKEGYRCKANASQSHAEGYYCYATGVNSHAEGQQTQATDYAAHAEGDGTLASADASHAEGIDTIASGNYSHAQGYESQAVGLASSAKGRGSRAYHSYSEATAGNDFVTAGDGQNMQLNAGTTTTDATPKELSLGYANSTSDTLMLNGESWGFYVQVQGRENTGGGDCYFAIFEGLIQRVGTAISLIPGPSPLAPRTTFSTAGASAWSVEIQEETGSNFNIVVTGEAATTIRWVANIIITKIYVAP